jgi:hypothetical protein
MFRFIMRHGWWIISLGVIALLFWAFYRPASPVVISTAPLHQQAYVWQRAWTAAVKESVETLGPEFPRIVVLAAQVQWQNDFPTVFKVPIDYEALRRGKAPFGLAIRIGPRNPAAQSPEVIADLAESVVRGSPTLPMELQLDFDCPESKLAGYAGWVKAIRERIKPVPLTITALPSWLNSGDFPGLAKATDGYVLQVHSLQRPTTKDATGVLCDPTTAMAAVNRAGRIGVPFRVALPTYGYRLAFDSTGKMIGLSAEGPTPNWPAGTNVRLLCADAPALAGLVRQWTAGHPEAMRGILWYRMPTEDDRLNWRWPTLKSVMAGKVPAAKVRVEVSRTEELLREIEVINDGDGDASLDFDVQLEWEEADLTAADAVNGFERSQASSHSMILKPGGELPMPFLSPGRSLTIGWLRLSKDKEVHAHVQTNHP